MNQQPQTDHHDTFTALPTAVQWSHLLLGPRLRQGDLVVDATAGNGHDTLFLAQRVLPGGRVFSFDVQAEAIEQTKARLSNQLTVFGEKNPPSHFQEIVLHQAGHERMAELLPAETRGRVRAIMFNLGYLPGGDKTLITRADTTLNALQQALEWLAPDGVVTIVVYPGHDGGREEAAAVEGWAAQLASDQFEAQRLGFANFKPSTPFCLVMRKRA